MDKKQSARLTVQHKKTQGVIGIFGEEAKHHDEDVYNNSQIAKIKLEEEFPMFTFRYRKELTKKEINEALQKIDKSLGQTLFVIVNQLDRQ
ncbi:MAG: hypothetical protein K2G88_06880 [Oscillospiraceae bacterium]|nr:hypothetical protein [Oscillospiraceae bacterium]